MKEQELRDIAKCHVCGRKIGHVGLPVFWRVRMESWGVDMGALKRQTGMEMLLDGHVALAQVMGVNEDMATKISSVEITLCLTCASEHSVPSMVLADES